MAQDSDALSGQTRGPDAFVKLHVRVSNEKWVKSAARMGAPIVILAAC